MKMLHWLLYGMLPAVAAVLLFVGVAGPRWCALALGAAFFVPLGLLVGWPDWPWHLDPLGGDGLQWFAWCLAGAGLVGTAQDLRLLPKPLAVLLDVFLVAALPWLLSAPLRRRWDFEQGVVHLGAAWLCLFLVWGVLRRVAVKRPGFGVPLVGAICLGGDVLALHEASQSVSWQLAGVAATALGAAVVTSTWRSPFVLGPGATLAITLMHGGLVFCAFVFGDLDVSPMLLLLLAPVPMGLGMHRTFDDGHRFGILVGAALAAAMVGTALGMI